MLRALNFLRKGHLETADEVIEFVNAIVIHRSVAPVPSHNEQHITRQIELLLHRFGYQIKEFVEKDPSIINRMLKGVVDTKDLALAPTKANPYLFSDPKGLVAFDPLRAELTIRGKEGVVLPAEVMSSFWVSPDSMALVRISWAWETMASEARSPAESAKESKR